MGAPGEVISAKNMSNIICLIKPGHEGKPGSGIVKLNYNLYIIHI